MSSTEITADRRERLTRLTSAPREMEAGIIVAILEQHGIRATMTGVATAGFRAEAPGWVHVLVAEEDLPVAQAVLEEVRQDRSEIDWEQVDVGESEDAGLPDAVPWWARLSLWRRIAFVLVSGYLLWVAVNIIVHLAMVLWSIGFGS